MATLTKTSYEVDVYDNAGRLASRHGRDILSMRQALLDSYPNVLTERLLDTVAYAQASDDYRGETYRGFENVDEGVVESLKEILRLAYGY